MVEVLGLDPVFRTSGGKGGGIIGVSVIFLRSSVFVQLDVLRHCLANDRTLHLNRV